MNSRIVKAKFNSLTMVLDSEASSYSIPRKNGQKPLKKMTKTICWSIQRDKFNTNYNIKIEIVLQKLYAKKIVMWNFHVDDFKVNHRYNIILGLDILS